MERSATKQRNLATRKAANKRSSASKRISQRRIGLRDRLGRLTVRGVQKILGDDADAKLRQGGRFEIEYPRHVYLAGDTLRSCADLQVPVVGVSLVHRRGYFRQEIHDDRQVEHDAPWNPRLTLEECGARVSVQLEGRKVEIRGWRHDMVGSSGFVVPVLLLDADVPENGDEDRRITDHELIRGFERA